MTVLFKEEDTLIQCVVNEITTAQIVKATGEINWLGHGILSSLDRSSIYCKAEEIKEKLERNAVANRLYTLPNGDGIDLRRVTAITFFYAMSDIEFKQVPSILVQYEGYADGSLMAATAISFSSAREAKEFRDELIKLVNSKGQPTWKADQIEAAPDGSGFGDWYQRYRVWNRDKTVVLLHTDVLKDAIEFLNKAEN